MSNSPVHRFSLVAFLASLAGLIVMLAFAWGFASAKFESFPYRHLREMEASVQSLKSLVELRQDPRSAHEIKARATEGGITINRLAESDDHELIFMTLFDGEAFLARLIDRQGRELHRWRIPYGEADLGIAKDSDIELEKRNLTIHGAHLLSNGDVLAVIEYRGLVRLDSASRLLWVNPQANHHALALDPDGSVWVLNSRRVRRSEDWIPMIGEPYNEDSIVHLSEHGDILAEISLIDVILENQYQAILYGGHPGEPYIDHGDPLHANDIDVLSAQQARHFIGARPGDLMVSLRTTNTIIVIDPETREIKWSMTGPFLRQHDPQVTRDGLLLVYDNRTAVGQKGGGARYFSKPQAFGYSRLIAIDPVERDIVWQYQGTEKEPFYSSIQGKHEELENGNVLAVEPEGGRVFEVDRASGEIVWEYVNLLEDGYVGRVTQAIPVSRAELEFLTHH